MKKILYFFIALILAADLAGCSSHTLQKKFTRKKKQPGRIAPVIYTQEGAYQKKYSNEYYYKTHFTMWKTWHGELINQLGGNHKKMTRCAQEAVSHLSEMQHYLAPEEQETLGEELGALKKISKKIEDSVFSDSEIGPTRVELERIRRVVSNGYTFDRVKHAILSDEIDLAEEGE